MDHKELCILRHAEATTPSIYQPDTARTLTAAGVQMATELGQTWHEQGKRFDKIIASPALRTRLTARLVAKEIAYDAQNIATEPVLYEGTSTAVIAKLKTWPDAWQQVLLVTHLPVVQSLLIHLVGYTPVQSIAPASYTFIKLDVTTWQQIAEGSGTICGR